MKFLHHVLAASYPALSLYRKIRSFSGYDRPPQLRVLLYHDIAPRELKNFELQLAWLSRSWDFISPQRFASFINGDEILKNNSLLITFDDGFASNLKVTESFLNTMKIKALFFVVSDLVDIDNSDDALQFIANHIQPEIPIEEIPNYLKNMQWSDLEILLEQGHTIGAHTKTHAKLSGISSSKGLEEEMISSADHLEKRLGISIDHFAYTFGNLASFSIEALSVAKKRFRYIYSGLRGNNVAGTTPPFAIRRDAISPSDPNSKVGALLEGGADFLYKKSLHELEDWAERTNID